MKRLILAAVALAALSGYAIAADGMSLKGDAEYAPIPGAAMTPLRQAHGICIERLHTNTQNMQAKWDKTYDAKTGITQIDTDDVDSVANHLVYCYWEHGIQVSFRMFDGRVLDAPEIYINGVLVNRPNPFRGATSTDSAAVVSTPHAYYHNCAAARAAHAAPIYVGQPGYRRKLDRDGDGVACE